MFKLVLQAQAAIGAEGLAHGSDQRAAVMGTHRSASVGQDHASKAASRSCMCMNCNAADALTRSRRAAWLPGDWRVILTRQPAVIRARWGV